MNDNYALISSRVQGVGLVVGLMYLVLLHLTLVNKGGSFVLFQVGTAVSIIVAYKAVKLKL
jgi:hypothetical protein